MEVSNAVIIRTFVWSVRGKPRKFRSVNFVTNPNIESVSSARKECCSPPPPSRFSRRIWKAVYINVFFPFIVLNEWLDFRLFNDAISTAAVIFIELCPVTFTGRERKLSFSISLYPYCLSLHLEELENHKNLIPLTFRNRSFQNTGGMLYRFSHRVRYFMSAGFDSPHEYYALSQSF